MPQLIIIFVPQEKIKSYLSRPYLKLYAFWASHQTGPDPAKGASTNLVLNMLPERAVNVNRSVQGMQSLPEEKLCLLLQQLDVEQQLTFTTVCIAGAQHVYTALWKMHPSHRGEVKKQLDSMTKQIGVLLSLHVTQRSAILHSACYSKLVFQC